MRSYLPMYSPVLALPLMVWACGGTTQEPRADAQVAQDGGRDASLDAGVTDSGQAEDTGPTPDAGPTDVEAAPDAGFADAGFPDAGMACVYPPATEPMTLDQVLTAYSWANAIDGNGNNFPLDLNQAYCGTDPNRDWGLSEIILFVTAPAW